MVWDIKAPYKEESKKIVWEAAPFLSGRGLDIGAGTFKVLPHAISVDNCHHEQFGWNINPDIRCETAERLDMFASQSMDFVYSSHLLEHLESPMAALKEWWRVLKNGGRLVLYLPHEDLYPKVGEPGANPDHKHNLNEEIVIAYMQLVGSWDLVECQKRDQDDEYSFFMVFKKSLATKYWGRSYMQTKAAKRALVCRFGAFGDLMMASSVLAGLKRQDYETTLMCSPPQCDVMKYDPNIDHFMKLDRDQVPNGNLVDFWAWQAKKYDKFVNLSESVEGSWLAMPGRTSHAWPPAVRHRHLNVNYLEFHHALAGVPHEPDVRFYPTEEEVKWAEKTRKKMEGGPVVLWSLAGSAVHKTWPYLDNIIAGILLHYPGSHIILTGSADCAILESGWENERRVHKTCGKWEIRQTLSFLPQVDLIIGPETGILNAACCMDVPKVVLLSHSSWENLTRDWKNTTAVWSENTTCKGRGANEAPACHQLHYGWAHCTKDKKTSTAQCQADIPAQEVWAAVEEHLEKWKRKAA